jgi:hypothetical protein
MKSKDRSAYVLNAIQSRLEHNITCASLEKAEDLYHEEIDEVVRAFWFSKGVRKAVIVVGANGYIHYYAHFTRKRISKHLIFDIMEQLLDLIFDGTIITSREEQLYD